MLDRNRNVHHTKIKNVRSLEDLIVSVLFSKYDIGLSEQGRYLKFAIKARKLELLKNYIQRNEITSHIQIDENNLEVYIKQSIVLEKILREWTKERVVTGINPSNIRTNTFLLWICLFARKSSTGVVVETCLSIEIQKDIPYFFKNYFENSTLYPKGKTFQIKPFYPVILRSIQQQQLAIENIELNYLLPQNEKIDFKYIMTEWEV